MAAEPAEASVPMVRQAHQPARAAEPVEAPVPMVRQAHQPARVAEPVEAPARNAMFAIRKKMRIFAKF